MIYELSTAMWALSATYWNRLEQRVVKVRKEEENRTGILYSLNTLLYWLKKIDNENIKTDELENWIRTR
jgi:hypothetical protein